MLHTLMTTTGIAVYCYFKYRQTMSKPQIFPAGWCQNDTENKAKALPPYSSQQSTAASKVWATTEKSKSDTKTVGKWFFFFWFW